MKKKTYVLESSDTTKFFMIPFRFKSSETTHNLHIKPTQKHESPLQKAGGTNSQQQNAKAIAMPQAALEYSQAAATCPPPPS